MLRSSKMIFLSILLAAWVLFVAKILNRIIFHPTFSTVVGLGLSESTEKPDRLEWRAGGLEEEAEADSATASWLCLPWWAELEIGRGNLFCCRLSLTDGAFLLTFSRGVDNRKPHAVFYNWSCLLNLRRQASSQQILCADPNQQLTPHTHRHSFLLPLLLTKTQIGIYLQLKIFSI